MITLLNVRSRGVTLLEILVAIGIISLIGSLILSSFSQFRARKTLDATVESTLASFSRAHLDTISSLNDKRYGIHIESDKTVYFIGTTYSAIDPTNVVYKLSPAIEIANITLNGGVSDIVFDKLTGGTSQYGTFEIRVKSDIIQKYIITINGTGAVSIQ